MARITAECQARIKASADIVELLGSYIPLKRAGTAWKACCPFHGEKTPSFHVSPSRQRFHCFGCGVDGDAVSFLMLFENLSYPDALRRLADRSGIQVQEENESPELIRRRQERSKIIELNKLASNYYHQLLCRSPQAAPARAYLKERGINIEMARQWQLGWAPSNYQELGQLARSQGFHEDLQISAYLLGRSERGPYPVFRDRLMFPILGLRGEILGFSGRILETDKDPRKYVNTADTLAFHKGELLFGLYKATRSIAQQDMTAVLCEGQIDVLACHEKAGVTNTIAGLGTAFTDEQAALLRKYAKRAILCYDGDKAGIKASEKSYRKLAAAGIEVYQASLPLGEDPDSLIQSQGAQSLKQLLAEARPFLEIRARQELQACAQDTHRQAAAINTMAQLLAEIADSTLRDIAIADIATRMHTGLERMRELVAEQKKQLEKQKRPSPHQQQETSYESYEHLEYADGEGDESVYMDSEDTPNIYIPPLKIHPAIRGLIILAAGNAQAQELLVERIEDLHDAITYLEGGEVLQRLLEVLPEAKNQDAWQNFLKQLRPEEAKSLKDLQPAPSDLENMPLYVEQACERAAEAGIKLEIDRMRSRMRDPQLSIEQKMKDLERIAQLQRLLNNAAQY